jgi:hypothetical protein
MKYTSCRSTKSRKFGVLFSRTHVVEFIGGLKTDLLLIPKLMGQCYSIVGVGDLGSEDCWILGFHGFGHAWLGRRVYAIRAHDCLNQY